MSTLKVSSINNASASSGGLSIDSSGDVTVSSLDVTSGISGALPTPNRNLLYNGAMQVHQRGTSTASITTGGYYTADRWKLAFSASNTSVLTQSIQNDGPSGSGLTKSLRYLVTTADASPAAGAVAYHFQILEGQDVQRVAKGTASAKELTVSFWVKSNATGTYVVSLLDADNNRIVSATYSVSTSATWEKKTVTFPADTSGVLDNNNDGSLWLAFALYGGSDYTSGTLASSWQALDLSDWFVGQRNLASATNNYWQITGVQLEVGDAATDFEFKSYGQELRECQRYYWRNNASSAYTILSGYGNAHQTTTARPQATFPVTMRTAPTTIETKNVVAYDGINFLAASASTAVLQSANGSGIDMTVSGATQYRAYAVLSNNTTDSYLAFGAEL